MKDNKNIEIITKRRILIFFVITIICFAILITKLSYMQLTNNKASLEELKKVSTKEVYGPSMPRGKIYDRNYNVIVDNVGTYLISYKKENDMTAKDEIDLSYTLADNLDIDYSNLKPRGLKEFWIANNKDKANKKIIKDYAKKLLNLNEMDRNWLFIYEVLTATELQGDWKALKRKKVTFIKI